MPRSSTESFIAEFPLSTSATDERVLSIRLDAARQIYNAVLGECLRILYLMRESRDWQRAGAMSTSPKRSSSSAPSSAASTSSRRWRTASP